MKLKTIIIIVAVYILSAVNNWVFFHNAFSKGGKWEGLNPDGQTIVWTFTPIFNTVAAVYILVSGLHFNPNKVFNIKN